MLWVYFRNLIVSLSQLSHLLYTKSVFEKVFLFVTECPENCTTFTLLSRLFIEFHCLLFCIYRTPSRCWVATQALPPCTRRRTRSVWGPTPSRPPWNTPTWTTTTVDSWNLPANWAKIWQWNVLVCNLTQMRKGWTNEGNYLYRNLHSIKWKEEIYVGSDIILGLLPACFEFLYILE